MRRVLRCLLIVVLAFAGAWVAPAHAIVNGVPAKQPYPFMVELVVDGEHQCGGSLIRPDWVLTAGHCTFVSDVGSSPAEPSDIEIGWDRTQRATGGRTVAVDRIIRDENEHNARLFYIEHDLALLHLAEPLPGRPIPLAGPQDAARVAPGTPATAIGWGSTSFAVGPYSDELLEVQLPIRSDEECSLRQLVIDYNAKLHVCAGNDTSGEAVCQGDSGGPLFVPDDAGYWVQLGVTNFGRGCGGSPVQMSVFAGVGKDELRRWVHETLPPIPPAPAPAAASPPAPAPAPAAGSGSSAKKKPSSTKKKRKPTCRTRKQKRTKRCRAARRRA